MKILRYILNFFLSLNTTLWFLGLLLILFFAGAFIMPGNRAFQQLHSIPLFDWIRKQPVKDIWWLLGIIGVLAVIAVNTIFCSVDSIIRKRKVTHWLLLIAPQIIHTGFIFMLLAHLLSAFGAYQKTAEVRAGTVLKISEGTFLIVDDIDINVDYYGYITAWTVDVTYTKDNQVLQTNSIMPNKPSVFQGFNINVKNIRPDPDKAALLQMNREPGAFWALTGGILFIIGIVILIVLKRKIDK
ncbi:MAG: hypothetical protein JSW20_03645 [Nitrospiraceae bacterium]|nr:MAG: hypothetical protein JSW20_03645 [Nitrospiraceae bacterium]